MLVGDAGKGGDQYDHQQANQPHLSDVQAQSDDQDQRCQALYQQGGALLRRTLGIVFSCIGGQHLTHIVRQQGAVAEPAQLLQQYARYQACGQHWQ
ncbi:hypothetical protein D3C78_923720 [compost metagenome]